ncbi:MAG TPA: flagellar biosynthetic protein FliO [Pseudolabrys sp.]
MFDTLFGMPLAARFFIAFLVVLALIGVTAWLVRRFGATRLGGGAARGRQPRLAVIDAATVDARRRLVLIRRDNVEHLLMIGGPTDVVVESNIVRAAGAAREPARGVAPAAENGWPLQPLNEPAPVVPTRAYRASPTEEPWLAPEPGARPRPAESLSPLPSELPPRGHAPELGAPAPRHEPPRMEVPRHEPSRYETPRTEPRISAAPQGAPEPAPPQNDQHNLAEMAQQLEAALRRAPAPEARPPVTDPLAAQAAAPFAKPVEPPVRAPLREFKPRVEPKFEPKIEKPEPRVEPKIEPRFAAKPEPKAEPKFEPKAEAKPEPLPASDKSLYDNLEEEMASLLGRPSGKP